ncbi:MAG: hypothetical protein ACPG4T_12475 [Nannocystaceae bacterium]
MAQGALAARAMHRRRDDGGELRELQLDVSRELAQKMMATYSKWQEPYKQAQHINVWLLPSQGLRLEVFNPFGEDVFTFSYSSYVPLATFLGEGHTLAFLPKDVWPGRASKNIDAAFKGRKIETGTGEIVMKKDGTVEPIEQTKTITFAPTDFCSAFGNTEVEFSSLAETIKSISWNICLPTSGPNDFEKVLAILKTAWGEPTQEAANIRFVFDSYELGMIKPNGSSPYLTVKLTKQGAAPK